MNKKDIFDHVDLDYCSVWSIETIRFIRDVNVLLCILCRDCVISDEELGRLNEQIGRAKTGIQYIKEKVVDETRRLRAAQKEEEA